MPDNPEDRREAKLHPTVVEHAIATGNAKRLTQADLRIDAMGSDILASFDDEGRKILYRASWEHHAASLLHGWALHDVSDPPRMTLSVYEHALKAAAEPYQAKKEDLQGHTETAAKHRARHGKYEPHTAALSPFARKEKE